MGATIVFALASAFALFMQFMSVMSSNAVDSIPSREKEMKIAIHYFPDMKAKIVYSEWPHIDGLAGRWVPGTNTIYLYENRHKTVLLHEAAHEFFFNACEDGLEYSENYEKFCYIIEALYDLKWFPMTISHGIFYTSADVPSLIKYVRKWKPDYVW